MNAAPRPSRKPISKRLRFEIYKRDRFTCVYCGQTPPAVVLELDHVEPHSTGGADDATNLVTACKDCNAGKSNRPLGEALPNVRADAVDEMRERVEQMRAYRNWRTQFDLELRAELDSVWTAWIDAFDGYEEDGTYHSPRVNFPSERTVLEYLSQLPVAEIVDAVGVAAWKLRRGDIYRSDVPRYFYGVLRGKARRADEERRKISVTWEDLARQVPELAAIAEDVASFNPLDPWNFCGDRIWQNGWNVRFADGARQDVASPVSRIAGLIGPKSENARDSVLGSQTAYDFALRHIKASLPPCGQTCECGRPKRAPRPEDYPRCEQCGQVTAPVDRRVSCLALPVEWGGVEFWPTPFGSEASIQRCEVAENYGRYRRLPKPRTFEAVERCPDCQTPRGGFHHPGCRHDTCPICGEPAGSGCSRGNHLAKPLGVTPKQAMARLRQMGPRNRSDPVS